MKKTHQTLTRELDALEVAVRAGRLAPDAGAKRAKAVAERASAQLREMCNFRRTVYVARAMVELLV